MNRDRNYSVNLSLKSTISFLMVVFMLLFIAVSMCHAQSTDSSVSTAAVDTVASKGKLNDSMKMVFSEMKKGGDDSMFVTIGMIVGVLAIVGVAMYISFREPAPKPKKA